MSKLEDLNNNKIRIILGISLSFLVIISFVGFSLESKKTPIRISFATQGGGVIFDHQLHTELKESKCQECHHNYKADKNDSVNMNCRDCHYSKKIGQNCNDENIHKRCIGKNCTDCHIQGSVSCEFCHNAENFPKIAQPQEIKFATDGGLVVFNHFNHASPDEYGLDCDECHHGYKPENKKTFPMSCRRCHYNSKYENICENADIHMRCVGKNCLDCHEEGKDKCEICHKDE